MAKGAATTGTLRALGTLAEAKRPALPANLAAGVAPTSASGTQLLPVIDALTPLLPRRGLQRGTVLRVDPVATHGYDTGSGTSAGMGSGATTLSTALIAAATTSGSWCVTVGFADTGIAAMAEIGVDLEHMAMIPSPGHNWAGVVATALDGVDLVLLRLPFPARPSMARNLTARARERRAVLIVLATERSWPEGPDLTFRIEEGAWSGVGEGHGYLSARRATVVGVGRRAAARPVSRRLWLPGPKGTVVPETFSERHPAAVR
jgi:hypothetical protein